MMRGGLPGARWIDPENYHITLRFIGDIDDATARDIPACSAGAAPAVRTASRWAVRPSAAASRARWSRRPRRAPPLVELQAEQERLLQRHRARAGGAQIHPACDAGAAARIVEPAGRRLSASRARHFRSASFEASRFVLFSSRASVGGGPYVVEAAYPLAAPDTQVRAPILSGRDATPATAAIAGRAWRSQSRDCPP